MAYGRRPRLVRLDRLIIGGNPKKLAAAREIEAIDAPALSEEQQQELYRLNYKAKVSTLSAAEEMLRYRLMQLARGRK